MKKLTALLFCALACITLTSCWHNDHDISISYSEDGQYYSMNAHFPKNRTKDIENYKDRRIGSKSNISFENTKTDATLTLDDHTTFYMKKYPGFVQIKLDKNKNSSDSYHEIKSMCQGIKKVLAK
ncbi:hypothetical protein FW778_12290 [Ginsengibacter hankyongi]|uniref:Lipoprotein n=1 Tax=Ginsengibacter hankyongi TaxID=2607284 RepID=A0A5J5IHI0_9BACT|nr:hypothetical protein [Ginsengibacter hankyongi]KAA9039585.1 hypothetical protein FW778_12290 [Ginsengibacter hankyongi]